MNSFFRLMSAFPPNKILAILLLLIYILLNVACEEEPSYNEINVEISNSELYQHPTVGGDEEGARIKTQAKHFEISEIIRNSETNYVATYTYKSKSDFIGIDFVEIEILTGSECKCSNQIRNYKNKFYYNRLAKNKNSNPYST